MKTQTKMVEEIFEEEDVREVNSWAPYYVHKLLNVSDPNSWYYSDKIICEMYHPKYKEVYFQSKRRLKHSRRFYLDNFYPSKVI